MILLLCAGSCQAGICTSGVNDFRHEFAFLAGYSPESATLIGTTENRRFVLAGFEYSYDCWLWNAVSIAFSPGAFPAGILLQPENRYESAHAVYGFAVTPIGFTFEFARRRRVHPFAELRGGIIASTERIPINVTDATALNFLFDVGGGLRWRVGERKSVQAGYKFLHISNAFTTPVNPGVDNNVFYVGFSLFR